MVGFCHGGNLPESHRHHHHHHHHNHHQQCWFNIIMARRKRCIEAIMGGPLYKPSHVSWSHHHVLIASSAPWEAHHHHHPLPSSSCIEGYIGQAPLINPLALSWSHHHVLIASSAQTSSSDSCSQPRIDWGIAFPTGERGSDSYSWSQPGPARGLIGDIAFRSWGGVRKKKGTKISSIEEEEFEGEP